IDTIPDLLLPLGFTDDLAVLALAYNQIKTHLTDDIRHRARAAADQLLRR
ncbi:TPA: YkvA family protein, partial [Neisseria bacilliformis]